MMICFINIIAAKSALSRFYGRDWDKASNDRFIDGVINGCYGWFETPDGPDLWVKKLVVAAMRPVIRVFS